jgi:hypothetical protein
MRRRREKDRIGWKEESRAEGEQVARMRTGIGQVEEMTSSGARR